MAAWLPLLWLLLLLMLLLPVPLAVAAAEWVQLRMAQPASGYVVCLEGASGSSVLVDTYGLLLLPRFS